MAQAKRVAKGGSTSKAKGGSTKGGSKKVTKEVTKKLSKADMDKRELERASMLGDGIDKVTLEPVLDAQELVSEVEEGTAIDYPEVDELIVTDGPQTTDYLEGDKKGEVERDAIDKAVNMRVSVEEGDSKWEVINSSINEGEDYKSITSGMEVGIRGVIVRTLVMYRGSTSVDQIFVPGARLRVDSCDSSLKTIV